MLREDIYEAKKEYREVNDCTVRAWATAFNCSYERAHSYLFNHGRRIRKGAKTRDIESAFNNVVSFDIERLPYSKTNSVSISKFIENHPAGVFYIIVRGHALCIKNGEVFDDVNRTNKRQVISAWKINEK